MGTTYNVSIIHTDDQKINKHQLQSTIDLLLNELNKKVSTYIDNSQISQFNRKKDNDWHDIDKEFFSIVMAAQKVSNESKGAIDITISPLVDLWGFGTKNTITTPNRKAIETTLSAVGYEKLLLNPETHSLKKIDQNLRIDLSSIAKGYAVDMISDYLLQQNYKDHLVEIGGEIRVSGLNQKNKKWRIAIQQPNSAQNDKQNNIDITNIGIATSGDYQNYYIDNGIRRSHILNPQSGYPITHKLASVTVLHKSTMLADAYATAILVLGENSGKKFAIENNLSVFMLIRENQKYTLWTNYDVSDKP